jgi:dTDP-4-amino-4,6-dideoxygalactose transaminase
MARGLSEHLAVAQRLGAAAGNLATTTGLAGDALSEEVIDLRQISFSRPEIVDEDIAAVTEVLRSGWLTTGTVCQMLEATLAEGLGVDHVVAVSSCTAALEISLAYLDLPEGSLVGVPTWTFVSTALSAIRSGLRPVLLDIDPDTLNVTPDEVHRGIELGIKALVPVHFGGVPVDSAVRTLCADHGIPVVEDAAHALGASDERGPVAGQGSLSACYSFYATKNLTSGEGGAIATDDPGLARFARSYRQHGMSLDAWDRYRPGAKTRYDVDLVGIKANLPDVLAALALSQLRRFPEMQARRADLVALYRAQLDAMNVLCKPTNDVAGSAHHLMVIELPQGVERQTVIDHMSDASIGTSVHFRPLGDLTVGKKTCLMTCDGTPNADRLSDRVLSLPLSASMVPADVVRVCDVLGQALAR